MPLINDMIKLIGEILSENGETKVLSLLKLCSKWTRSINISEPLIFEHVLSEGNIFRIPLTINPQENIEINWGDGTTEKIENKDDICLLHCVIIHNYTNTRIGKKI